MYKQTNKMIFLLPVDNLGVLNILLHNLNIFRTLVQVLKRSSIPYGVKLVMSALQDCGAIAFL